jgi:uncharacterized repeat protein (TIGR03803 family)
VKTQINKILPLVLALTVLALHLPAQAQTFTLDNPLLTARWGHAATLLTNGLVLVAGGRIANDYVTSQWANTNNCELYDPASGSSTLTGPMNDSHFAGAAAMLTNGLVLIVGGENNGQYPISGAELYDSSTGTWTSTGSLQQERESFASVLLPDGRMLVIGGYDGGGAGDLSSTEIYAPNTKTWTNTAPLSFAADSQTATLLPNGKVLVAGGSNNGNALTKALLYNPANNTWTNTGSLNVARAGHVATLLPNGKVLVVGGGNSAEVYDSDSGSWSLVASMNDGRSYPSATLLPNGQVLVLGGDPGQTSAELYNPTNNTWTYTGALNVGRVFHTATLVADGQVVVIGGDAGTIGYYNGPPMADVETYNQAAQNTSFGFALNTTNLVWTTGGDTNWFVESTNTHDNVAAAQSGAITDRQQSWIQTTVTGPGTLSFWWQVSSETNYDFLEFDLDGNPQDKISGTGLDWAQKTYSIPSGTHTLQWLYSKDPSGSDGLDAGFLDEVSYVATPTPGLIVTASPLTGPVPLTVQFTSPGVDSGGNTVTNWNWNFGDGGTSTAQSPSHVYTNFGSFSPSLEAYSTFGALPLSVTGPGTITVTNHTLNVAASPQVGPLPLTVQFSSPGVDSGGKAVTNWNWNFDDGGTSTAQNPSHIYTGVGSFSPNLVARSTYSASPLDVTGLGVITVTNTPNPAFSILYTFSPAFGSGPNGSLVLSGNTLYGTTSSGGTSNSGTLYAINTDASGFTNLYNFNSTSGWRPNAVILSGSTLYGPTDFGGNRGGGTVFAISTNGTGYTNLYNLNFAVDPNSPGSPQAPLVLAGNNLYGATWYGGAYDHGTLFSVATNGSTSGILHAFYTPTYNPYANNYDGLFPSARLTYSGGTLYGTAENGGGYGGGAVFSVITNQPGSFSILHYFSVPVNGTNSDGAYSFAGLVLSGTNLYGTTFGGGTYGNGTVFAVSTNGLFFTNLYSFTGGNDGSGPHGGLTLSGNTLYGTTSAGGTSTIGTLFAVNTDGSGFTSLYSFTGGSDGANPQADLVLSGNTLYGTAASGGSSGNGTVFSFTLPSSILLTNLSKLPGGSFQFSFLHTSGSTNTVFATTNLALAFSNWTALGTATEVSSGHFQFTDSQATNNPIRFYRVRSP